MGSGLPVGGVDIAGLEATASPRGSASPGATSAEVAFRAGFLPLVELAAADARALVATGEARDRNLLRVRRQQEAMLARLSAADAWLDVYQIPSRYVPAATAYREGAASIRAAMDEAQAGFLRFDFGRVARATETLGKGNAALDQAITLLDGIGSATPIP